MLYFIEIISTASGIVNTVSEKANMTEAAMALHQTFASAMANPDVSSCLCIIINGEGLTERLEKWVRP